MCRSDLNLSLRLISRCKFWRHFLFSGRIAVFTVLGLPAWPVVSNPGVLASTTQSQQKLSADLTRARKAIAESEEFADEVQPAVNTLNDHAIQALQTKQPDLRRKLTAANADLERYLTAHPNDVEALLLQIHLDTVKVVVWQPGEHEKMAGGGRDVEKTLDLILRLDPGNAEAYYDKAQLAMPSGSLAIRLGPDPDLNFSKAADYARKAVEHAPENATYREFLAMCLHMEGKEAEAAEAVKSLDGGAHPAYRLALDHAEIPVPDGALFSAQESAIQTIGATNDHAQLRVRSFIYPGPASKVEEFYRKLWPEFRLRPFRGDESAAVFRWKNKVLKFSPEELPSMHNLSEEKWQEQLGSAFVLYVTESNADNNVDLKKGGSRKGTIWERLPDELPTGAACTIDWVDYRKFP